jgi:Zn-dependent M16 (insulinase) family peptidase
MSSSAFAKTDHRRIEGLNLDFHSFEHRATGARHLHMECDDPNNAFMIAFPTLPTNSTGVAHMLEHTTLCGSRNYPVRDPFFMMLRRSLNTYMNAFTSGDSTAYPFATQNPKDFSNLLAVYLDAVFFPLLDPLDFAQEGWRVEFADPNSEANLMYKGVVFNEMKGAMSAPSSQLWQRLHSEIFPDTVYRYNSGGEPNEIPNLSYEQLKAFHRKHYHPSHATLMTYGNFPVERHHDQFESLALHKFERCPAAQAIASQARFSAPISVRSQYAVTDKSELARGTHAIWAWVVGNSADPKTLLEGHLLAGLLLDNGSSPLRQYLETTSLADAPSELCMLDDSAAQLLLCCGVEGTEEEHVEQIGDEIFEILRRIASNGVDHDTLIGLLDQMEIAQRDIGGGGYPYGLQLMGRILPSALHGGAAPDLIDIDQQLLALRQRIEDPTFIAGMIRTRLIDNPHHARLVMLPDDEKIAQDNAAEASRLAALLANLDVSGRQEVRAESERLERRQNEPQNADCLPKVTLNDVPKDLPQIVSQQITVADSIIVHCAAPTNGLCYFQIAVEIPYLDDDELVRLPLFCEYLTELGSGRDSYVKTQQSRAQIGNFSAYVSARASTDDGHRLHARLVVTAKGLARKRTELVEVLFEILASARFDESNRITDLIAQSRVEVDASITERGHLIAVQGACGALSAAGFLDDLWDGPTNIKFVRQLDRETQHQPKSLASLASCFEELRNKVLTAPWRMLIVGEQDLISNTLQQLASFDTGFSRTEKFAPFYVSSRSEHRNSAWITNTQVNFCARAYPAVPEAHADASVLAVLAKYLQDGFLHPAIREKGGAYGAGAQFDPESATFRFFSYRDPRLGATLADFDESIAWLDRTNEPERLEESILGVIRGLDAPRTPAGAAIQEFYDEYEGRSRDFRIDHRNAVLATKFDDLYRAAARYLVAETSSTHVITHAAHEAEIEELELERHRL